MTGKGDDSRAILEELVAEAQRAGRPYVGTEDLLLGILRRRDVEVVRLLASFGVTYDSVHDQYASLFPAASTPPSFAREPMAQDFKLALTPLGRSATEATASRPAFTSAAQAVLDAAQAIGGRSAELSHLIAATIADRSVGRKLIEMVLEARGQPRGAIADLEQHIGALFDDSQGI